MALIETYLRDSKTLDVDFPYAAPAKGGHRFLRGWLASQTDLESTYDAKDEVQVIPEFTGTPTGGTYTITLKIRKTDLEVAGDIVTGAINYNAIASVIEATISSAVNTAGTIPGWSSGDISVGGSPFTGDCTLTFDGDSVKSMNHPQCTAAYSLTGGSGSPMTTSVNGNPDRLGLGLLLGLNVVSGADVAYLEAVNQEHYTKVAATEKTTQRPPSSLVEELVFQLGFDSEDPTIIFDIQRALGLPTSWNKWPV